MSKEGVGEKKKQVLIQLPEHLHEAVVEASEGDGIPVTAWITFQVVQGVEEMREDINL